MITIRNERKTDATAREALLDVSFGESRWMKASERLREGRLPADELSFAATDRGRLIGTARLWHVSAGPDRPALLLGPVAVDPDWRGRGVGTALVERALRDADRLGHRAILLVGDAPYYGRFGFSTGKTGALWLPGPFERHRLLGRELAAGALDGARGVIAATGRRIPKPARVARRTAATVPHAA
ncbi:MAG: GNAT family N-acetyltransferase [Xanthobacteraceae bacterium]